MRVARNRQHTRLNFALHIDAAYFHVVVTQQEGFFEHFHNVEFMLLGLPLAGKGQ